MRTISRLAQWSSNGTPSTSIPKSTDTTDTDVAAAVSEEQQTQQIQLERATADMLGILERIILRRGDDAASTLSTREHCCGLRGILMSKAFVIGLPVREAYTGTTLELCHELTYDTDTPSSSRPAARWKKYIYSEEEAREDEDDTRKYAIVDLLDVGPLDQQEHEALYAARDRLCSLFPGTVKMRLI